MKIVLNLQFLTCKKYSEHRSTVNNCNFSKLQFFKCTSTVIPLHIFAVHFKSVRNISYLSISMDNWSRWQTSLIVSRNIKVLMISEHPIGKKNQTAFECISKKTYEIKERL